jgi:DNA helicase II / ATP-dependent DNA helicase PcrA
MHKSDEAYAQKSRTPKTDCRRGQSKHAAQNCNNNVPGHYRHSPFESSFWQDCRNISILYHICQYSAAVITFYFKTFYFILIGMNSAYTKAYEQSAKNAAQKQAIDTTEGPVLVIAGPGTGKTQLLGVRVGRILENNPTLSAYNILCLTFTESGAANMRDRLSQFIGREAYDVTIGTYHSFGGDIIKNNPQYFTEHNLQNPVDDLGRHQILDAIVAKLPYSDPLKQTRHHIRDLMATVSEVKRALLTSNDLKDIAASNLSFYAQTAPKVAEIMDGFGTMNGKLEKLLPYFEGIRDMLAALPQKAPHPTYDSLTAVALQALETALTAAEAGEKKALTAWKNKWLEKNSDNQFVFSGELESRRIASLASVLDKYQAALHDRGLYDFDDMILQAIDVLQNNPGLKYTLQERYQYILLDEFQDTNAAQLKLVQLLTDNPVNENKPNVMAVGDDDQAIYAFQGAQYSNMVDFYQMYRDVVVVNLTDNYRSHADILESAANVLKQIDARVFESLEGMTKTLRAANTYIPTSTLTRKEYISDVAEAAGIADEIARLIQQGVNPREIAIIAPRHRQLQPIVPYLKTHQIPIRYEKRENILESPIIQQIITMARLSHYIAVGDITSSNALWPEVLSYAFWQLPVSKIWKLSWQVDQKHISWNEALLQDNHAFRPIGLLFIGLAARLKSEQLETMLDYIIGNSTLETFETDFPQVSSKLRDYYLSDSVQAAEPETFYETITHLSVLRAKLREHQQANSEALYLEDLLQLITMYEQAEERMVNTSPYTSAADAVQVMTAYKAKGLEFEHVFLPSLHDDVWGGSGGGGSNKLTLPKNLSPIRYSGTNDDERLRVLFVAITRAKYGLHLSSYAQNYAGKATKRLKYLDEEQQVDGSVQTNILPEKCRTVQAVDTTPPALETMQTHWAVTHHAGQQADLHHILQERLESYQVSPTHLSTFTDLQYGGPHKFFLQTILRFPQAPTVDGIFGSAIHDTLEWVQHQVTEQGSLPAKDAYISFFESRMLRTRLPDDQRQLEIDRGIAMLEPYIAQRGHIFAKADKAEQNFRHENVVMDMVPMAGKIDRMEIDPKNKTIVIVDYKTGKSFNRWLSDPKLHKYKHQLYGYRMLVENSRTFRDYSVAGARLEFVEPNSDGKICTLELPMNDAEYNETKQLIQALYTHVKTLDFPDVSKYQPTLPGIKAFEKDLLDGTI